MQKTVAALREQGDVVALDLDSILGLVKSDDWSEKAILAHRAAELAKAPPPSPMWRWQPLFAAVTTTIMGVSFLALFISVIGFALSAFLWCLDAYGLRIPYAATAALVCGATVIGSPFLIFCVAKLQDIHILAPAEWITVQAKGQDMPRRAHDLVDAIQAFAPCSTFTLEKLVQNKKVLDPILYVSIKNASTGQTKTRPILVWDGQGNIISPPV